MTRPAAASEADSSRAATSPARGALAHSPTPMGRAAIA